MEFELGSLAGLFNLKSLVSPPPTHALPGDFRPENASLSSLSSLRQQEQIIIRDLKYVLIGRETIYLKYSRSKKAHYVINKGVDLRFRDSIEIMTKLGSHYQQITSFIETFNDIQYGQTMGAFCHYLETYLNHYIDLISNINEEINLIDLIELLDPYFNQINQIHQICTNIEIEENKRNQPGKFMDIQFNNLMTFLKRDSNDLIFDSTPLSHVKGGIILNIIDHQSSQCKGDPLLSGFLASLYEDVSSPYLRMLNKWINNGEINDPFEEFGIICIDETIFAWRSDGLIFDSPNIQNLILLIGKYKSIIRGVGNINQSQVDPPIIKSLKLNDIIGNLTTAYQLASAAICDFLQSKYNINELIPQFLDWYLIRGPINKTFNDIIMNLKKLTINEDLLIRLKECYFSKSLIYTNLSFKLDDLSVIEELQKLLDIKPMDANEVLKSQSMNDLTSRFQTFNNTKESEIGGGGTIGHLKLDIDLPSPLNEIISRSQQYELGIIFKYLTLLTYLERRFDRSWREIGYSVYWTWSFNDTKILKLIKQSRIIHMKLFEFLKIYCHYVKYFVIESNINVITSINDLSQFKNQLNLFLSSTLNESLLTDKLVSSLLFNLIQLLLNFSDFILHLKRSFVKMDNIKSSVSVETPEWIDEKINSINDSLKSYSHLFEKGCNQLTHELGQMGELDNGKVLFLRENLLLSFSN